MTLDPELLAKVVGELSCLTGSRIQRVDVMDDLDLVIEVRAPGRTITILISARPALGRVHLIDRRPPKTGAPGALQGALRRRLEGRPLLAIASEGRTVRIDVPGTRLSVRLDAAKEAFHIEPLDEPRPSPVTTEVPERFPISDSVRERYAPRSSEEAERRLRAGLLQPLDARLKKRRRLLGRLDEDRRRLVEMLASRKHGELLKSVLYQAARGQRSVTAKDWETGEDVVIPLEPTLDARQNLERFFARAKKADRGIPFVDRRRAEIEAEVARIAELRTRIASAKGEALTELARELTGARPDAPEAAARPRHGLDKRGADRWARRFVTSDGAEVLVGKGAAENDRLTFGLARGHDLWLHARGVAGAHVVLRLDKGAAPTQEGLLDAAHLAAHYSSARKEERVEIQYAEARYVKKLKGAPPGQVSIGREKTMLLRLDAARLARLLEQAGGPS